jgi:putative SOS response-associated peptidase YedK
MCGRYVTPTEAAMERQWSIKRSNGGPFGQRHNIAPQQGNPANYVPIIRRIADAPDGALELVAMQWWLLPNWSREPRVKFSSFNARVESVSTAASFRVPFRRQRCLFPVQGWYEWQELPTGNRPWYFHAANDEPLAFAGIWDRWEGDGEVIESCSIVVGEPNDAVRTVHDRMPFIIPREREADWLDPALTDADEVMALLQRAPEDLVRFHRVAKRVNNARLDDPALMQPLLEPDDAPPVSAAPVKVRAKAKKAAPVKQVGLFSEDSSGD